MLNKKAQHLRENHRKRLYLDLGDYRRTVFLAGMGRSGTTWVEDIINYDHSYRVMFEPFHTKKLNLLKGWNYRQYLRPDNQDEMFLVPAKKISSGRIKHEWVDRFNDKWVTWKRLVKDIRANLILRWVKHHFPEIPIVLLLRHPCAVASSKIKLQWEVSLEHFFAQEELMRDHLNPFRGAMESAKSNFEKHIFIWCVENYVPLKQFGANEVNLFFYEQFCTDPEQPLKELLNVVGSKYSSEVLVVLRKPSHLSRKDSAIRSGESLVGAWQKHITPGQKARAIEILTLFGLDQIYDEGPMPKLDRKEVFLIPTDFVVGACNV